MSKKVDLINCPDFGNDLREEFRNISKFDPVYKYLQDVCLQRHPNINDVPSYSSPNFDYYKHPRVHENRAVEILDTPIGRASMFEYLYDDDGRRVRCVVHSVVSFQMDRYDCSSVIYLCVSFWDMINKIGQTFVYKNVAYRDLIAGHTLSSKYVFNDLDDTEMLQEYMDEAVCLLIVEAQEYAQSRISQAHQNYCDFSSMIRSHTKQELFGISQNFSRIAT
jgi:hypothetical protein